MSFNKIIIVGNLGRDPELKYTPQGQQVCEFSLASSEKHKSNGETKEETTWFKVSLWGKQAEVAAQYLAKGREVYVEGRLRTREWTDKEGRQRTSLEVFGTDLRLLGSRSNDAVANVATASASTNTGNGSHSKSKSVPEFDDTVTEDDIPF